MDASLCEKKDDNNIIKGVVSVTFDTTPLYVYMEILFLMPP